MQNARRSRFLDYFNGPLKGSREVLMKRTGLTKGRVSQLFDENQPFGELAARNLAEKLGLASDYFEIGRAGAPAGLSDRALDIARQFDQMTIEEQQRFMRLLVAAQDPPADAQWVGDLSTLKRTG
jgi:hypothetical protein